MKKFLLLTFLGLVCVISIVNSTHTAEESVKKPSHGYPNSNKGRNPIHPDHRRHHYPENHRYQFPAHYEPGPPNYYYRQRRPAYYEPEYPDYYYPEYPDYHQPQDYREISKKFQYIFVKLKEISRDIYRIPEKVKEKLGESHEGSAEGSMTPQAGGG